MSRETPRSSCAVPHVVRTLTASNPRDVAAVQAVLESAADYTRRVMGHDPQPTDGRDALVATPPGLASSSKRSIGLWAAGDDDLLAFADVLHGWPRPGVAHIGLLVVHDAYRGHGLGRVLHDIVVEQLASDGDIDVLRLGIVATNAEVAEPFWRALGYAPTGETVPYDAGDVHSATAVWERSLAD